MSRCAARCPSAIDVATLIHVVYNGQAMPTNQIVAPSIAGYDPNAKKRVYDPAAAAALLDRFGYNKRDAQNYRLQPDGKPLTIVITIFTGNVWREIQTLIKRDMDALGVRVDFKSTPLQDVFKEAAQGKFMMNIHGRSATPIGTIFQTFYGTQPRRSERVALQVEGLRPRARRVLRGRQRRRATKGGDHHDRDPANLRARHAAARTTSRTRSCNRGSWVTTRRASRRTTSTWT